MLCFAQVQEDCPDCPWWQDVRNASQAKAAFNNVEAWMMLPGWMVHSWYNRGAAGLWATQPPQQVVGHAHTVHQGDRGASKVIVQLFSGTWTYRVGRFALNKRLNAMPRAAAGSAKLLVLAPSVQRSAARLLGSDPELRHLLLGLLQVRLW